MHSSLKFLAVLGTTLSYSSKVILPAGLLAAKFQHDEVRDVFDSIATWAEAIRVEVERMEREKQVSKKEKEEENSNDEDINAPMETSKNT